MKENSMKGINDFVKKLINDLHQRVFQGMVPENTMNKLVTDIDKAYNLFYKIERERKVEPTAEELEVEFAKLLRQGIG